VRLAEREPLSRHTRFGIGGPAALFAECDSEEGFVAAMRTAGVGGVAVAVIGGGSNLVVSDAGFEGLVVRYRGEQLEAEGERVRVGAGVELQALVDFTIGRGLKGLETMTGIPGWVGAAIYGNAGAYGHSISERVVRVRFWDGERVREFDNAQCGFAYRESVFKDHKEWIIFSAELGMDRGDAAELRRKADGIREIRDAKYPPTMKCAGSIFKNCILAELPESVAKVVPAEVIREGKVASAWFLEQVGAKGLRRGDIQVAAYHANLIYNDGAGTAADLCAVIVELKLRVRERFGLKLEEEVQYVGL
jgi:UDP-N-acetylmuramate dehydrogenase